MYVLIRSNDIIFFVADKIFETTITMTKFVRYYYFVYVYLI